jgi:hypothetical protein
MPADLLANARRECDRRRAAGEDTTWLDRVAHELEPLAAQTHDLDVSHAIRMVIDRHGAGPYPAEELATIAGITPDDARPRAGTDGHRRTRHPPRPLAR